MSEFLKFTTEAEGGGVKQVVNNFRPIQKLHDRVIMTTIKASSAIHHHASYWLFSFVFVLIGYNLL